MEKNISKTQRNQRLVRLGDTSSWKNKDIEKPAAVRQETNEWKYLSCKEYLPLSADSKFISIAISQCGGKPRLSKKTQKT